MGSFLGPCLATEKLQGKKKEKLGFPYAVVRLIVRTLFCMFSFFLATKQCLKFY